MNKYPTRLTATKIAVGASVSGTLEDIRVENATTKDGRAYEKTVIVLNDNGEVIELSAAGNLKFLAKDVADGKRNLGEVTTITRREDKILKNGFKTSNFLVTQGAAAAITAAAEVAIVAKGTNDVAAKLAALRAQRAKA